MERCEEAHVAQAEEAEAPALLMAQVCSPELGTLAAPQAVYLNEEKVVPKDAGDGAWYADTGASSHMTGSKDMFASLDETVHGTVGFGDGSLVDICGKGTVLFKCLTGDHRVLSEVYFIPRLRSNIISLGQLDEKGCEIVIKLGILSIYDQEKRLLARIKRSPNRLYKLTLDCVEPVCLLTKGGDTAWLWHARYGHLHFRALRALSRMKMARGIPDIESTAMGACWASSTGRRSHKHHHIELSAPLSSFIAISAGQSHLKLQEGEGTFCS